MRNKWHIFVVLFFLLFLFFGCNLPGGEQAEVIENVSEVVETQTSYPDVNQRIPLTDRAVYDGLEPNNLVYLGAFRLPDGSGESSWEYSGQGLTYYPGGDQNGGEDGFPGSLIGIGHDHQLYASEISIPVPVISQSLEDLNTAETIQPFAEFTGGVFNAEDMVIPVVGIEYLADEEGAGKLHFAWGQHIQDLEPSHGWGGVEFDSAAAEGPWVFGTYSNYITSDYLFEIPADWAAMYAPGMSLASGRFREGVWGGMGPALLAYDPSGVSGGGRLDKIVPLLVYGVPLEDGSGVQIDESMKMETYQESDRWSGGTWLSSEWGDAVVFVGTKAVGRSWYGFSDGTVWPHDCADQQPSTCPEPPEWPYDDRGYWAEDYQAQMIFFDVNELGQVAVGEMAFYEPQPYAVLDLTPYLFSAELNFGEYKRELVGAVAFDRTNGLIYLIERMADEYKSVIHVFQITENLISPR